MQLNWEAIGAMGEILGAVTVVAALLSLAAQVRSRRTSTVDATDTENRVHGCSQRTDRT